jgi:hypothetical protein
MDEEKVLLSVQLDGPAGPGTGQIVSVRTWEYDALDHGRGDDPQIPGDDGGPGHALGTEHGPATWPMSCCRGIGTGWICIGRGTMWAAAKGLVAKLSRERLKDTTLDYGPGRAAERDATAAYAMRAAGFRVPESEVVVCGRGLA